MKKYFLIFILLISIQAFADGIPADVTASCSLSSSNGVLDSILSSYYDATVQWRTTLAPIALKMYWFWFTCEFLWQLTIKKVLGNDISKLYYWMMVRILVANLFAYIFVNPDFYVGIIQYFINLGAQAGNFTVSLHSSNPFTTMSPSGIMNTGACLWGNIMYFLSNNSGIGSMIDAIMYALPMMLTTICVYLISALMAIGLIMTALEAFIVMNAGIILLGFAGSSWTQSYWQKYLSYVGGIAIRLFVMCLILGLMTRNLNSQFTELLSVSSLTDYARAWAVLIKILISMFVYAFLVLKVPAMAGSMLTGTVNSGLGDVIAGASMVMAGAGMAAGLGKMGFGGGSGSSGGGAKESFKNLLTGNGGGGLPTGGGGGSERATQTATQTAKTSAAKANQAEAMMPKTDSQPPKPTFAQSKAEELGLNKGNSSTNSSSNNGSGNQTASPKSSPDKSTSSTNKSSDTGSNSTPKPSDVSGSVSGQDSSGGGKNQPQSMADRDAKANIKKHGSNFAKHAQSMTQNHNSGAADISISPHKE